MIITALGVFQNELLKVFIEMEQWEKLLKVREMWEGAKKMKFAGLFVIQVSLLFRQGSREHGGKNPRPRDW